MQHRAAMRAALALIATISACSANEAASSTTCRSGTTPESGTACVTYAGAPSDGKLPYEKSDMGVTCAPCAPRCGATTAFGSFWSADALPTGHCDAAPTCDLAAVPKCGCASDRGPVNSYRCVCESGQWRCFVVVRGASICRDSCPDAATDG